MIINPDHYVRMATPEDLFERLSGFSSFSCVLKLILTNEYIHRTISMIIYVCFNIYKLIGALRQSYNQGGNI